MTSSRASRLRILELLSSKARDLKLDITHHWRRRNTDFMSTYFHQGWSKAENLLNITNNSMRSISRGSLSLHRVVTGIGITTISLSLWQQRSYGGAAWEHAYTKYFPQYTDSGKRILIPPKKKDTQFRRTLVLDMDEMLVGNASDANVSPDDISFHKFRDRSYIHIHRPYLAQFLQYASENFEVVLWTAGTPGYANECVRNILRATKLPEAVFDHIIARDSAWFQITPKRWYRKDLAQLGRLLEDTMMIENAPVVEPHTHCILVPDYRYPIVMDNHVPNSPLSLTAQGWLSTLRKPKNGASIDRNISNFEAVSNVHVNYDQTLRMLIPVLERWKDSSLDTSEFLRKESTDGALRLSPIRVPRENDPTLFVTLPLYKAKVE